MRELGMDEHERVSSRVGRRTRKDKRAYREDHRRYPDDEYRGDGYICRWTAAILLDDIESVSLDSIIYATRCEKSHKEK